MTFEVEVIRKTAKSLFPHLPALSTTLWVVNLAGIGAKKDWTGAKMKENTTRMATQHEAVYRLFMIVIQAAPVDTITKSSKREEDGQ